MLEQTTPVATDFDCIAVDWASVSTGEVRVADLPPEVTEITTGLVGQTPPTNPLVVLKAARWWYVHGRGVDEPVFRWAIEWTRHLATDQPPDVQWYHACLDRLLEVGFATDRQELRSVIG